MSTLGAGARSLRAPTMPSMVGRPTTGSNTPGCMTGPTTGVPVDHVWPPLCETDMISNAWWPPDELVPMPKTYALPLLSVRMVQPSLGFRWLLFADAVIGCWVHVVPPSDETPTISG